MNANRTAFLAMIRRAEGTSTSPATTFKGYDVIVTGADGKSETFDDFSAHPFASGRPAKLVRPARDGRRALFSTASGAYQLLLANWTHYSVLLQLPDFGPDSQDQIAIQQITEFGGLPFIDAGQFDMAVSRIAPLWASLPRSGYGQPEHTLDQVRQWYVAAGGIVRA
jgi:muramidase (phage lysozyme)